MCVTSMVGDFYKDKWTVPGIAPGIGIPQPSPWPSVPSMPSTPGVSWPVYVINPVTRDEFDALRRDVLEMKELMKRAKAYDELNNEPHCELDDKVELLRRVAELVGITLDDVFPRATG